MSFKNVPTISCDWPGCRLSTEDFTFIGRKAAEMRKALAARFGWAQIKTMDFCDHHPLADHVPKIEKTPAVSGVSLPGWQAGCSCGWVEVQHFWATPGYVWTSWVRHLPREDWDDCTQTMESGRDKRWGYED